MNDEQRRARPARHIAVLNLLAAAVSIVVTVKVVQAGGGPAAYFFVTMMLGGVLRGASRGIDGLWPQQARLLRWLRAAADMTVILGATSALLWLAQH